MAEYCKLLEWIFSDSDGSDRLEKIHVLTRSSGSEASIGGCNAPDVDCGPPVSLEQCGSLVAGWSETRLVLAYWSSSPT